MAEVDAVTTWMTLPPDALEPFAWTQCCRAFPLYPSTYLGVSDVKDSIVRLLAGSGL